MAFAKREIDPKFKIDPRKATKDELDEAMALLAKKRERAERVKKGELKGSYGVPWSEMSKEQKDKARKYAARRVVRQSLLIAKAAAAGVTVSDKEVDAEIAKRSAKK